MSLEATEKECAANAVAPRVSLADIKDAIAGEYHLTADKAVGPDVPAMESMRLLSICILVMKNGFTIIGKSAPASAANFNAELGRKLAYEDAVRQVWPLMGFALRDKLAQADTGRPVPRHGSGPGGPKWLPPEDALLKSQ